MEFVLNDRSFQLDAVTVWTRVTAVPPDAIRTHWVELDGRRWPPKQAFRIATGLIDEPFISHYALRVFQRLGFVTSTIPDPPVAPKMHSAAEKASTHAISDEQAVEAFVRLDRFLMAGSLTSKIADLEAQLDGADQAAADGARVASGIDEDLVDSALVMRERIGMLDTLLHAAVITRLLPQILEPGETVLKRPSLGAGNDPDRAYDLETSARVAEFKLSSWKGADGARQRGLFADVVGLSLDLTARRRQVYVVGPLPVAFLRDSRRNAAKTLSKAALRLRSPDGLTDQVTVSEYTKLARIEVIDLTTFIPGLR